MSSSFSIPLCPLKWTIKSSFSKTVLISYFLPGWKHKTCTWNLSILFLSWSIQLKSWLCCFSPLKWLDVSLVPSVRFSHVEQMSWHQLCNSEARALPLTTKVIGLNINPAHSETILHLFFKFKTETSEKIVTQLLGGHKCYLGRERNPTSFSNRRSGRNIFVFSVLHSPPKSKRVN